MAAVLFSIAEDFPGGGDGDEVIASGAGLLAEFEFLGVAAEVGVEGERDEMFVNVVGIDFVPGEPPGAVARAGASRPSER